MQSKDELEKWYQDEDPWKYATNPDDHHRKDKILAALKPYGPFKRALDIGCGEGWLTQYLPAKEIHGIELSETAQKRFPKNVKAIDKPSGKYDLVITTGTLYQQYNWREMLDQVKKASSDVILVAGIKDWFIPEIKELGKPIYIETFKYRKYEQEIRIYKCKK